MDRTDNRNFELSTWKPLLDPAPPPGCLIDEVKKRETEKFQCISFALIMAELRWLEG